MATFYPTLHYEDAPAAIDWLKRAFGMREVMVVPGEDGRAIAHAELALGEGIVMLGSLRDDALAVGRPGGLYVAVDDPDALHARAREAGAEIVREPAETGYGSRDFAARDLEGNLWSFGTYRPKPPEAL